MKKFILSNIDEFNTSEAYYGNPIIKEDYITIPYINIELMEKHPLNVNNEQLFIDFCFLQIIEPKYISVYGHGIIKNDLKIYDEKKSRWYGGLFIGDNSIMDGEMEIQAKDISLIMPIERNESSKMWMPKIGEHKNRGNIEEKEVINFFNKTSNIKKININLGDY